MGHQAPFSYEDIWVVRGSVNMHRGPRLEVVHRLEAERDRAEEDQAQDAARRAVRPLRAVGVVKEDPDAQPREAHSLEPHVLHVVVERGAGRLPVQNLRPRRHRQLHLRRVVHVLDNRAAEFTPGRLAGAGWLDGHGLVLAVGCAARGGAVRAAPASVAPRSLSLSVGFHRRVQRAAAARTPAHSSAPARAPAHCITPPPAAAAAAPCP